MSTHANRWVVGLDLRPSGQGALRFAHWLAGATRQGQPTFVGVHVLVEAHLRAALRYHHLDEVETNAKALAERVVGEVSEDEFLAERKVICGRTAEEALAELARPSGTRALVIGRQARRGEKRLVRLGRVARRLLRTLPAPVVVVISNRADAGALEFARSKGIATAHISRRTHEDPGAAILACLYEHEVDVVVLAGYLRKLDPRVVAVYTDRAINIHPAPLPRFGGPGMYGEHVHQAVLQARVPLSGPTVHRVTAEYDEGEILAHQPVPVMPDDDPKRLAARVLQAEHDLLWRVIRDWFCPKG
ncbi:MAG: universal stress protein [Myxococcales bacterium]|nr:universal stress protein [Myxococcales bacterium]